MIMEAGGSGRDLRPQRLAARVERGAGDRRADQGDAALQRAPHPVIADFPRLTGSDVAPARLGWGMKDAGASYRWRSSQSSSCGVPGSSSSIRPVSTLPEHLRRGPVVRAVDGDTLEVAFGGRRSRTVRLIGVDTPETVKPDTPVQCFGPQASAFDHRTVEGRRVRFWSGVELPVTSTGGCSPTSDPGTSRPFPRGRAGFAAGSPARSPSIRAKRPFSAPRFERLERIAAGNAAKALECVLSRVEKRDSL